jgi:hypothetical protein
MNIIKSLGCHIFEQRPVRKWTTCMQQNLSWKSSIHSPHFMEVEDLLLSSQSQELALLWAILPCWRYILIIYYHSCLSLLCGIFLSGFPTNMCAFLISPYVLHSQPTLYSLNSQYLFYYTEYCMEQILWDNIRKLICIMSNVHLSI